jgi:hypothetical protein
MAIILILCDICFWHALWVVIVRKKIINLELIIK